MLSKICLNFHDKSNGYPPSPPSILKPLSSNRTVWLDWCRTFAIISIVFCHVTESVFPMHQIDGWNTINASDRLVCLAFFTFGRLGVPFFLFLSGYLLLSKHQCLNLSDIKIFLKKKWLPLLICWYIWILLYNLLLIIYGWGDVSLSAIKNELLLKSFPPIPHLWFMPMIVKVYLLIPLFSFIICRFGKIAFLILLAGSFLSSFKYEFWCYATFILVGYFWYLYIDRVNKLMRLAFLVPAIVLFCYIVQVQFVDFMNGTVHKV